MSAGYFDFKSQYKKVAESIEKSAPGNFILKLEKIAEQQKVDDQPLHPDVVKYLKNLLNKI